MYHNREEKVRDRWEVKASKGRLNRYMYSSRQFSLSLSLEVSFSFSLSLSKFLLSLSFSLSSSGSFFPSPFKGGKEKSDRKERFEKCLLIFHSLSFSLSPSHSLSFSLSKENLSKEGRLYFIPVLKNQVPSSFKGWGREELGERVDEEEKEREWMKRRKRGRERE